MSIVQLDMGYQTAMTTNEQALVITGFESSKSFMVLRGSTGVSDVTWTTTMWEFGFTRWKTASYVRFAIAILRTFLE